MPSKKSARHAQMKKELKQRKKAAKVKEGRKPFCKWETKRSLRKKLESMGAIQKMLNEAEDTAEMWHRLYVDLKAENLALLAIIKDNTRTDVTDDMLDELGVSA